MIQLQLSRALDKERKHDHKVFCTQRNQYGLYVGTLQETEDGHTGHLLSPKHPLLPPNTNGRLGFLHSNRDEAFEALALCVAKAAWTDKNDFEITVLDKCSHSTQDAFKKWLLSEMRSTPAFAFLAAAYPAPASVNIHKTPEAMQ